MENNKKVFSISKKDIEKVIAQMKKDGVFDGLYKRRIIYIIFLVIWLIISILIVLKNHQLIFYTFILYGVFVLFLQTSFSKWFKKTFSSKYAKLLSNNLDYSTWKDLFPLLFDTFDKRSWLLDSYAWIDFEEDSIKLTTNSFNYYWEEAQTYTYTTDNEWKRQKTITNHVYVSYVEILKHRFPIKNGVKLVPDINDNWWRKILNYGKFFLIIFSAIFIWLLLWFKNTNWIYIIILFIIMWIILSYLFKKERIKLENIDFEKIFDVYSEDETEARRLLTPKMMEKLVELVKNSWQKGRALKFVNNKIYAKFDVSEFLEVWLFWKSIEKGVENFLKQIKLITDFINYLNVEYFSEVEFLKEK